MNSFLLMLLFLNITCYSCLGSDKISPKSIDCSNQSLPEIFAKDIQTVIYNTFVQSLITKDDAFLKKMDIELKQLYKSSQHNIILYWHAYLQFYSAIYYLESDDKRKANQETDKGIDFLKMITNKNSEDYALLALLQSFSIQFGGMSAPFISQKVERNAKKAIAMDSSNLRGYYVYASHDFYTPEKYGGGKKAEQYLLKALSLEEQKVTNKHLPSWGKEEAYEMIIKLYLKKENLKAARKFFKEGINLYPDSYGIKNMAEELIGK